MKKSRFEQMQDQMLQYLPREQGQHVAACMKKEYESLCETPAGQLKSMAGHTRRNIFPVAAAFRALLAEGMEREAAAKLAGDAFLELMQVPAAAIQKALKFPGLYRLMPWLWKTLMPRMFSEESGFRFRFYPPEHGRVKFDMTECPYHRICRELDCMEIAPVFCATDDVCYGHMHPKLIWNRTKTLARGGDLCDFDLYIQK